MSEEAKTPVQPSLDATIVSAKFEGPDLARGTAVGRYLIVDRLGEGGMAVVCSAYDPELDRKVALKLLKVSGDAGPARELLLREAQAMARLSHPNVVPVFDAGAHEGQLFVAMEFEEGQTLRAWLAERARARPEILGAFLAAGEGLAAAHAAGIVHRDFKPENVLVGRDGRILVSDFGLAHLGLSAPGEVSGTPAYMAPEQFTGEVADPRADQFSFCVALWEALTGSLPFEGSDFGSLKKSVLAGELRPGTRKAVPARLLPHLLRGLSKRREERFPGLADLLRALRHNPWARARQVAGWAGLALVLAGLAATLAWRSWLERHRCEREVVATLSGWNDATRATLQERWGLEAAISRALLADVDRRVQEWGTAQRSACEQDVRGEPGARPALTCLATQQRTAVLYFQRMQPRTPEQLHHLLEELGRPALCLEAVSGPPRTAGGEADALEADINEAAALSALDASSNEAARLARRSLARAKELGALREVARAEGLLGKALRVLDGPSPEAERNLRQAILDADAASDDETSLGARIQLASYLLDVERLDEAERALAEADAWLRRAGSPLKQRARFAAVRVDLLGRQGKHEEALAAGREALDLAQRYYGSDSSAAANARLDLASELEGAGQHSKAAAELRQALDTYAGAPWVAWGDVAIACGNLAVAERRLGHLEEAMKALDRGEQILTGKDRGTEEDRAWLRAERAMALGQAGRQKEAEELFARLEPSLDLLEQPTRAELLASHARTLLAEGHVAAALPVAEQAWKLGEESPEPLLRAITRFALAQVLAASRRDPPRALELAAQALEGLSGPEDASTRGVVERWLLEQKALQRAGGRP